MTQALYAHMNNKTIKQLKKSFSCINYNGNQKAQALIVPAILIPTYASSFSFLLFIR
jgi:hypothetical protein